MIFFYFYNLPKSCGVSKRPVSAVRVVSLTVVDETISAFLDSRVHQLIRRTVND